MNRAEDKQDPLKRESLRKAGKFRAKKFRNKKKSENKNNLTEIGSYRSRRYFVRASKRAQKIFPFSPRKKQLIEENFRFNLILNKKGKNQKANNPLSEEDKEKAMNFYGEDDISCQV